MQTKSISHNIRSKMDEWIATINDTELRNDLTKNILVSGGCVASMFLNESVNDYDVYIQDRNVLLSLVKYYTKPFGSLKVFDGKFKDDLIDEYRGEFSISEFLKHNASEASALRTLRDDQIKIFIPHSSGGYKVGQKEGVELNKYIPVFFSPNAISLTDNIQIVIRFWGSPDEIHKTFDFVHPTNYFTYAKGIVLNQNALESLLTKQLKYQGSFYPVTSIIRSKKFIKRGWNINAGELMKIMFQISKLNLDDMDVLEEQLIGVDVAYFGALIEALRDHKERNPDFELTTDYFNTLIDRIFNNFEGEDQ